MPDEQPPAAEPVELLIIEDDVAFAELVARELETTMPRPVSLTSARTLAEGVEALDPDRTEVVLLDLNLPDSRELASLDAVLRRAPRVPVIVLTALSHGDLPLRALRMGAQDFLPKAESDGATVARALSYAIERSSQVNSLAENVQRLERLLAAPSHSDAPEQPLLERDPAAHERLVDDYAKALDLACTPGAIDRSELVSEQLRSLAIELGTWQAGARDLINVHLAALDQRVAGRAVEASAELAREGQVLLLELMGDTLAYYRERATPPSGS